jgi:hypothetical protein
MSSVQFPTGEEILIFPITVTLAKLLSKLGFFFHPREDGH